LGIFGTIQDLDVKRAKSAWGAGFVKHRQPTCYGPAHDQT
jgi:hypothetical protein